MFNGGGGGGGADGGSISDPEVAVVVDGVEMYRENYNFSALVDDTFQDGHTNL
jgi:hypothetical protein